MDAIFYKEPACKKLWTDFGKTSVKYAYTLTSFTNATGEKRSDCTDQYIQAICTFLTEISPNSKRYFGSCVWKANLIFWSEDDEAWPIRYFGRNVCPFPNSPKSNFTTTCPLQVKLKSEKDPRPKMLIITIYHPITISQLI